MDDMSDMPELGLMRKLPEPLHDGPGTAELHPHGNKPEI
jgi:hypothetical protein